MEKLDARQYLITNGFTPGKRGRFSKEQIQFLRDSGLEFTKPIKDAKVKGPGTTVPLV